MTATSIADRNTQLFPALQGERIRLIPLSETRLAEMFEYSRDPRLYAHLEFPPHRTVEDTAAYLAKLQRRIDEGNAYYWFVELVSTGTVIGTFGVLSIDWRKRAAEIGYGIGPAHWRRGYFQEAARLVLDLLFDRLDFFRVSAVTAAANAASIAGLERLGFRREGRMAGYYQTESGDRLDAVLYARTAAVPTVSAPHGKYSANEVAYVTRALDSEDRSNKTSPWSQRFETAFARELGSRYAIAHNSGTSALHSCLAAAGVGPGDEVISPALTVVMDAFATIHCGATPVFADVLADTQNVNPQDVIAKITPRTKAILTVSLQGLPADVEPLMAVARERGITVVEDCAQTMLGRVTMRDGSGRYSGTIGHMGVFSFEAKKHVSTGEGGMVVTSDELLAERVRKFGGIGYKNMRAEAGRMSILPEQFQDPAYERFDTLGLNYRMPEVIAAIGLAQFERAHDLVNRRRAVAAMFDQAVAGCTWMVPQVTPAGFSHTYYTYSAQYFGDERHGLSWRQFWRKYKDLGGDGFYGACRPPYLEPVFRSLPLKAKYGAGLCPVAEDIQRRIMQFKTNYRDLDRARHQTDLLARLIDTLGR